MISILSDKNPQFKNWKKLKRRKQRVEQGQFIIEGWKLIEEAVAAKIELNAIIICQGAETEFQDKIKPYNSYVLPRKLYEQLAATDTPQPIMAIANMRNTQTSDEDSNLAEQELVLVLDRIQDPGNMGTIIRTAHAAGISILYLTKGCADVFNEKVIRSAMGSSFHIQTIVIEDERELMSALKGKQFTIATAHVGEGSTSLYNTIFNRPLALILGNEAAGPSEIMLDNSNVKVKIPLLGGAESLNVGIAAGIIIYEIVRQLKFDQ
ncbi:TrmH family RNA methyltransferase [Desulfitispora alkaliphila]|uniref:TrmH family RNA methyltransferase n=1 Tax=Desulfitispora alkaliphila TaxID=622674 RepID=UPI003D1FC6C9